MKIEGYRVRQLNTAAPQPGSPHFNKLYSKTKGVAERCYLPPVASARLSDITAIADSRHVRGGKIVVRSSFRAVYYVQIFGDDGQEHSLSLENRQVKGRVRAAARGQR